MGQAMSDALGGGDIGNFLGATSLDPLDLAGNKSGAALAAQTAAANQANATQRYMYDTTRADNMPWLQAGTAALTGLQDPNFGKNLEMDPGYQFRLDEGMKAINASAAARGMGNSGAALKELARYGQDYASNEYNNAYNRQYNRLTALAGIGQQTNTQNAAAGANYANNVSATQTGLGNAQAAQIIGQQNSNNQLIGSAAGAAAMAFCDERLKIDITPVSFLPEEIAEMKKHLKAYSFNYISPEYGEGNWIGVMAQDLQKSSLGRTLVSEDSNGNLKVDMKKAVSLMLAMMVEG